MRAALVGDPAWVRQGINLWHRAAGRHGPVYRTWCGEFVTANMASSQRPRHQVCPACQHGTPVLISWAVVQGIYHRIEDRGPFGANMVCGVSAHRTVDALVFTDRDPDENNSPRQMPCEHCIRGLGRDEPIPVEVVTFADDEAVVLPPPVPSPFAPVPTKRRRNETVVWPTWDARKLAEALGLTASHVEVKSVELKGKNSKYDYSMQPKAPRTVQEPIEVTLKFQLTGPMFERVRQAALNGEGVPRAVMLGEAVVTFEPDVDDTDPFKDDAL